MLNGAPHFYEALFIFSLIFYFLCSTDCIISTDLQVHPYLLSASSNLLSNPFSESFVSVVILNSRVYICFLFISSFFLKFSDEMLSSDLPWLFKTWFPLVLSTFIIVALESLFGKSTNWAPSEVVSIVHFFPLCMSHTFLFACLLIFFFLKTGLFGNCVVGTLSIITLSFQKPVFVVCFLLICLVTWLGSFGLFPLQGAASDATPRKVRYWYELSLFGMGLPGSLLALICLVSCLPLLVSHPAVSVH